MSVFFQSRHFILEIFLISLMVIFVEYSFADEVKLNNDIKAIDGELLRSITFIVDADKKGATNDFYSLTNDVFLTHEDYKTEFVVRVNSLLDISIYLDETKPPMGGVWSRVYIVAHSSEQGLTIPIANNDDSLADFKTLKDTVVLKPEIANVDDSTVITIWACGLGNYADYLVTLKRFFKGLDGSPSIRSPKLNTHFARDENTGKASVFFAQEYYLYSSRKDGNDLAKEFSYLYGDNIDWFKALNNNETIVGTNNFSEQRKMRVDIVVERAWLEEFKTLEELIPTLVLEDFPLAPIKPNARQFKWAVKSHTQPENVILVGRTRKVSVFVPKSLVASEWGSV